MKKQLIYITSAVLLFVSIDGATASKKDKTDVNSQAARNFVPTPESLHVQDSIIASLAFQFEPNTLRGQVNGTYAPYEYKQSPSFPLWIMMNMGGALVVDTSNFVVNECTRHQEAWLVNMTCNDSVNGKFDLQFVIEPSNKTMLKVTDSNGNKQLYDGQLYPFDREIAFKNEKAVAKAINTQSILDQAVANMNFQVRYADGKRILKTPRLVQREYGIVSVCEKVNDTWFVRIEYPDGRNNRQKTAIEDFSINSFTGETFRRASLYDKLPTTWRHYKDTAGYADKN